MPDLHDTGVTWVFTLANALLAFVWHFAVPRAQRCALARASGKDMVLDCHLLARPPRRAGNGQHEAS